MKPNISGMENLSKEDYDFINKIVEKTAKHSPHIASLDLNIVTQRTSGARQRYSISAKALTEYGFFKAEAADWKINLVIKEVLRKLDVHIHHELKKKKGL